MNHTPADGVAVAPVERTVTIRRLQQQRTSTIPGFSAAAPSRRESRGDRLDSNSKYGDRPWHSKAAAEAR